jgi:PAS domain S-box-containing protein
LTLPDGRIIKVNETFLSLTGYTRAALLEGLRFRDLLTVPGKIYHDTHVAPLLQMQGSVREIAFEINRIGNTALPVLFNAAQRMRPDGQPLLITITVTDATHRRQYEHELLLARRAAEQAANTERAARELAEQASRTKDEFLALVSHELRTPLSAILGWTQVLRRQAGENNELMNGLAIIERNVRLQVRLVDDLLDLSRVVSGKLRLDVQRVDLASVIEAAIETAQPAADARSVRLQQVLDPGIVVSGDPGRLQQVFWNLLSNAVKFTPRGGLVRVLMERVNSHIEISVIDSGQGMSAEFLAHAFERFRQSDSHAARETGGLGLGLSIVKHLVEMHGGSVEAQSAGEQKGSTFIVKLPVVALQRQDDEVRVHPRTALTDATRGREAIRLHGIKVVVVDDEPDARDLLLHVLRAAGAEVFGAASASEGVMSVERNHPHVLISDIGMPGEDGYELIRRVRMLGANAAIPAVALTAYARLEDRTQALLAGYQIHVAKPVDAHELLVTVASLAGRLARPAGPS